LSFELTIADGKGKGSRFAFEAPDVTIGRGAENDVVLYDPGVSRTHARIQLQGADYFLLDNGSANGTELNGAVIEGAQRLRTGDQIRLGPILFRFEARKAAGDQATRITAQPVRNDETRVTATPAEQPRAVAPRAGGAMADASLAERLLALPKPMLLGIGGALALLVALIGASIARSAKSGGIACPDVVDTDDAQVVSLTFGHGMVDVDCGAKVAFGFTAPPQTRALLHYLGTRIAQPDEVEVQLNGVHVGWAPVAASRGEEQVVTLPDARLSKDGKNVVTFKQQKGRKEWTLAKVRVEMLAIAPGDLRRAREAYNLGRRKQEERRIAPRNLYDAWKYFVEARRYLEGLEPRPALYGEVAQLIKEAERDLEKECSRILFSGARFERYRQDEKAQLKFKEALLYFPGEDPSGCRKKARERISSTPLGGE